MKSQTIQWQFIILMFLTLSACSSGEYTVVDTDYTDGDADADSDADSDTDSDADSDTDSDADSDTDTDTDTDTDIDTDTDSDTDTDTDSDTDTDTDTDTDSDTDSDADSDTDTDADSDADTDTDDDGCVSIPTRIEAEEYINFSESDDVNEGSGCDRGDGVDLESTEDSAGGGCNVGWSVAGEWLEYCIDAGDGGNFNIYSRVASDVADRTFHIEIDGVDVTNSRIGPADGWQIYSDVGVDSVPISAGSHTVRFVHETGDLNLNWIDFSNGDGDTDTDSDTDSDSDSDSDTDTDTETDTDFIADTDPINVARVLTDFPMDKVVITDDYLNSLFDAELAYVMSLDPDRLMAAVKAVSEGIDPDTTHINTYGGWEASAGGFHLRSHTLGHWLSALALAYKQLHLVDATRAAEVKAVIDYTIGELKTYQDRIGTGFIYGSFETHFNALEGTSSVTTFVPWYNMHKVLSGILDSYLFADNETALQVADALGTWVYNRVSQWDENMRQSVMATEYGGMNDVMYKLYNVTKDPNHLAAARIFDEDWAGGLFDRISQGADILDWKHANTTIPKFIGAIQRYQTTGDMESFYRTSAEQFWNIVLSSHTYVTGGNSQDEHFRVPNTLDAHRDNTNNETCNAHNMLKLSRNLFMVTGDIKYSDYYERNYINEILASINPDTGMTTYFKPMATGGFKMFGSAENSFWCCTGTGMENFMKLDNSIYYHDSTDLWVNLYISSTLDWTNRNLALTAEANLPSDNTVTFTIDRAPNNALKIKFRKPYWVDPCEPMVVTVNGTACDAVEIDGYIEIERVWHANDTVELTFPMDVRVSRLSDNQNAVAFTYGPIVLSTGFGTENMVLEGHKASGKPTMIAVDDTIAITNGTINDWIGNIKENLVQSVGTLEFHLNNTDSNDRLTFTPHYLRYQERYGIYFILEGTQGGDVPDNNCSTSSDVGVQCESVSSF